MRSTSSIAPYPIRITDRLEHWAAEAPDRVFLAQRPAPAPGQSPDSVTRLAHRDLRATALEQVRRLAQGLLDRKLSRDRTVVILSGNSIEHGLLALAAMYVGVPYAPIAPAYSLQANEFGTLRQVFERMKPGLVFAAEGALFERALTDALPAGRGARRVVVGAGLAALHVVRRPPGRADARGRCRARSRRTATPSPRCSSPRGRPASRRA